MSIEQLGLIITATVLAGVLAFSLIGHTVHRVSIEQQQLEIRKGY